MNKIEPISPDEVSAKKNFIPDEVIAVFNNMIVQSWDGQKAIVKQYDVIQEIVDFTCITDSEIFEFHYLDIEDLYIEKGWDVEYNLGSGGDSFRFIFRRGGGQCQKS